MISVPLTTPHKRHNSSSAVGGTIPVVGLWALLKPIMTAPFVASLSLWNSLVSDAQFKKGEAIYIYMFFSS